MPVRENPGKHWSTDVRFKATSPIFYVSGVAVESFTFALLFIKTGIPHCF